MGRKILSAKALQRSRIASGFHFGLHRFETKHGGQREMLCRMSSLTVACKALPLLVSEEIAANIRLRGRVRKRDFAQAVLENDLLEHALVPLLACDRPVTYFPGRKNVKHNWIYELPGGVVEDAEHFSIGGIREMLEELGIKKKQVLCFCCLSRPRAFDSGSHAEWVGMVAAICCGTLSPPKAEGIRRKKCKSVTLGALGRFLAAADAEGIASEGYIEACRNQLLCEVLTLSQLH